MSVTLATIADALIEFILSLLRDPEAAAEFDADPENALAQRGLSQASAADVCAVAPVIAERPEVVPMHVVKVAAASAPAPDPTPVVREIKSITNSFSYIDDRDTLVDQSVNQNIWAGGDVTQVFDQEAVIASGDHAMAAGHDATVDTDIDQSTTIGAGGDVAIDSSIDETTTTGSNNTQTETTTTTDASTVGTIVESGNTATTTDTVTDSYDDSASTYTETAVDTDSTTVFDSSDVVVDDASADDDF
ncbi:IniB N-terminal domain-containing protein [Microbacterium sp. NPDC091313]